MVLNGGSIDEKSGLAYVVMGNRRKPTDIGIAASM
jgi:hypothetical protein